ncbi:MFS transporter [Leifsonia poae]|uniref:MFS transporter n=1 Tax=Leifsonia poae TaxID=110933 RepID=A0A9W6HCL7_9MICO|nr:MFS transporter [Leifsonia poae]GLJ77590.1 MFS transporter [Leifsonia poae]
MTFDQRPFSFRSVALAAFLPTLLFSIGEGAIIPIIPIAAGNLGASLAIAGLISSMVMLGELVGDIPSGWVVSRIGERTSMIYAAALAILGVVVCLIAPNYWVLMGGIFVVGLATAVFALARHAFMTSYVPARYRARALSTLGGIFRAGWFIGPLISSLVIALTGSTQSVFWIFIISCLGSVIVLIALPDPEKMFGPSPTVVEHGEQFTEGEEEADERTRGLFRTIWSFRAVLARMGTGVALIGAIRSARTVLMPLWAVSIGLSESNTALIIGIAGAVDFALFYASGQIMDRWGRMWSAIPSMLGLSAGFLTLAFTHDLDARVAWYIGVSLFLSIANGIGSGIIMTLGADLAPKDAPAPFLGAWRFAGDAGQAAAPLLVSLLTAVASIAVASGVIGVLGLVGAGLLARYIPRFVPRRPRPA